MRDGNYLVKRECYVFDIITNNAKKLKPGRLVSIDFEENLDCKTKTFIMKIDGKFIAGVNDRTFKKFFKFDGLGFTF